MSVTVVAMDATHFHTPNHQYQREKILRELNKAYCGFYIDVDEPRPQAAVATGSILFYNHLCSQHHFSRIFFDFSDWGCGVFNGNVQLKFLIQLIAACANERDLQYHSFGDAVTDHLDNIRDLIVDKQITIGEWQMTLVSA